MTPVKVIRGRWRRTTLNGWPAALRLLRRWYRTAPGATTLVSWSGPKVLSRATVEFKEAA